MPAPTPAPALPPSATPTTPPPAPTPQGQPDKGERTQAGSIILHVAESAKVRINDRLTKATGNRRTYVSHLEPGMSYRFEIQIEEGGRVVKRDVLLEAGQTKTFELQAAQLAAL